MSNIEIQGLSRLQEFISSSKVLDPKFNSNDKTPCWDGDIFVYSREIKKENLLNRIPVQIKSTLVKVLSKKSCKFPMEVADLKNYFNDGGIIVFVIEVLNFKDKRIFYKSLLPNDIKILLDDTTKNQRKKTIYLDALYDEQIHKFEMLCLDFIKHRELQYSTKMMKLNIAEAKQFMITGDLLPKNWSNTKVSLDDII